MTRSLLLICGGSSSHLHLVLQSHVEAPGTNANSWINNSKQNHSRAILFTTRARYPGMPCGPAPSLHAPRGGGLRTRWSPNRALGERWRCSSEQTGRRNWQDNHTDCIVLAAYVCVCVHLCDMIRSGCVEKQC